MNKVNIDLKTIDSKELEQSVAKEIKESKEKVIAVEKAIAILQGKEEEDESNENTGRENTTRDS